MASKWFIRLSSVLLATSLILGMVALLSAPAGAATEKGKSCGGKVHHDYGRNGYRHGGGRSFKPPPNCKDGSKSRTAEDCKGYPRHDHGRDGWRHGDGISYRPPPGCKPAGSSKEETTTDSSTTGSSTTGPGTTIICDGFSTFADCL